MTGPPIRAPRGPSTPRKLLLALAALLLATGTGCALPGQRSAVVRSDGAGEVLERSARAAEGMHFRVKAIDRSHQIMVAEGRVEGGLAFHDIRLSIKVVHIEADHYRVEAIATADERGIREGAEKKARELFFRKLRETATVLEE